jgi:hypothetical protein
MNFSKRLWENRRGITALVIGAVVVLVTCAVLIPIGIVVTSNIGTVMAPVSGSTTAYNSTYASVFNNIYSAFSLSAIVPIVAAAGVIIAIIVGVFAFKKQGD